MCANSKIWVILCLYLLIFILTWVICPAYLYCFLDMVDDAFRESTFIAFLSIELISILADNYL